MQKDKRGTATGLPIANGCPADFKQVRFVELSPDLSLLQLLSPCPGTSSP